MAKSKSVSLSVSDRDEVQRKRKLAFNKRRSKSVSEMAREEDEREGKSAPDTRKAKSVSEMDGVDRVIAMAEDIVFRMGRLDTTDEMLGILSSPDSRFSHKTGRLEAHLDECFRNAEALVSGWTPPATDIEPYLQAVDEIQSLLTKVDTRYDTLERARSVNREAMVCLSEEFRHALHRNSQFPDTERLDSVFDEVDRAISGVTDVGFLIDLVRPEALPDIRAIAQRLIVGKHEQECCQVYGAVRRKLLEENLCRLGLGKMTIEEIQKITWESLDVKIKKWIPAIKIAVRVLFPSEKELCSLIFQGMDSVEDACFSDTCKVPIMRLLIFSEATAITSRSSERLFRILDMYEALSDLVIDIDFIFSDEDISAEASGIVARLGKAARGTFVNFANVIERDGSKTPIAGGAIHPLTGYVMNYTGVLFDYTDALLKLVTAESKQDQNCPDYNPNNPNDYSDRGDRLMDSENDDTEPINLSPFSQHLLSIIEILECKLDEKSKLYKDPSLAYFFLMNNIQYIVHKVKKSSELRAHLGDDWVRKRCGQVRQLALNYQRAAWNKVLVSLKDAGLYVKGSCSGGVPKRALKERFKRFNAAFEEVYRTQKTWTVPDLQLREELRISITEKLVPAYRSFVGRYRSHLHSERHAEKYIKYTAEDLENYLMELFEGSSESMHQHQRSKSLPQHFFSFSGLDFVVIPFS